jgi:hypothetical protein
LGLFRRDEPAHLRLAREGGLVERDPRAPKASLATPTRRGGADSFGASVWREVGIHGMQRAREWDATVTTEAEGIDGDAATFVALPDGTLLVEDGPDSSLQALADAVERELKPPYRARAARVDGDLWGVQARRIDVRRIPNQEGEALELTAEGLRVDGRRAFGSVKELEGLGDVVRAERLDGDLWEVRASPL